METTATRSERLRYQEYDRISIPEDVPGLGIEKGEIGVIRRLHLHNETVFAFVAITYTTGQTRGWVIVELKPQRKVRSYKAVSR